MAKLGRYAQRRRTRDVILASVIAAVVLAAIGGIAYYMATRPKPLNLQTLCPADGPLGHVVLLVDKTDPLNFTQKQAFAVILRELVEKGIPEGHLFSVFVLGDDFKETSLPLIELCNPGTGADKSEYTANLKKLRRQYEAKFVEPLLRQADFLQATQPAKISPILEMVQLVSINAFRKHNVAGDRRLVLMSDMLQNTPQLSMYRGPVDFASFASSDYGRKSQLELRDVAVELHYLMNAPQLQTKRNLKFWEDYFGNAGARIVSVRPLEG